MHRIPKEKVCLLGALSDKLKSANVLIKELEEVGIALSWIITCATEIGWSQSHSKATLPWLSGFSPFPKIKFPAKICLVARVDHAPLAREILITPDTATLNTPFAILSLYRPQHVRVSNARGRFLFSPFLFSCKKEVKHSKAQRSSITTTNWHEVGELKDRSLLSDEMASLCSKYRIYKIEQDRLQDIVTKLSHGQGNAIAQFPLHKFSPNLAQRLLYSTRHEF